ncbi:MAG: DNA-3-methyladenine glycosylase I [Actinomycetia bacterium]|nr:DNA-3-methyladenine glycosylase I [Actinomycetes bacterium]
MPEQRVVIGDDGVARCWWGSGGDEYQAYHDTEWGLPQGDDIRLFEKVCLEGFQSGLSWLTILAKRENFRSAFSGFDPSAVSEFGESDIERLLGDAGIVRHRGKIEATINNAGRALEMTDEFGSLAAYFWAYEPERAGPPRDIPAITDVSTAISKDLKSRGWRFVGPTTAYAFMQAMGLVNDHLEGCEARTAVEKARVRFEKPEIRNVSRKS